MPSLRFTLAALSATLFATAAGAATISYGTPGPEIGFPLRTTNFTANVSVPKFDTALGTLSSVSFSLAGTVVATLRFESRNATPATLTGLARASIRLNRPDASALVVSLPQQAVVRDAAAFDGVDDFGGTSGFTLTGVTGAVSETSGFLTSASDLSLFSSAGGGTVLLPVVATGQSSVSGAGNVRSRFTTQAAADLRVTYTYTEAPLAPVDPPANVPEPASWALLGGALLGFGLVRRQR